MLSATSIPNLLNQSRQRLPQLQNLVESVQRFASDNCSKYDEEPRSYKCGVRMWETRVCCPPRDEEIRHDVLYLRPTPRREYTRTWKECEYFIKSRRTCEGTPVPPEREWRPRKASRPGYKIPLFGDQRKLNLRQCVRSPGNGSACARITVLPCTHARKPPKCVVVRHVTCCQKRCVQYPAFSECKRTKPLKILPIECLCLRRPPDCIFKAFRKFPKK